MGQQQACMCVSDDQTQEDMSVNIHKSKKFHFQGTSFKALDVTGTGQTTTELTRDASPGDLSISPIDTNGEGDELSEFLPKNIHQKALDELFVLCKNGASATLKFLIHYNTELDYLINEKRRCNVSDIYLDISALQFCAACGNDEVLRVLLECPSINCNIKDSTNQVTALHLAVLMDHHHVVEILCKDIRVNISSKNVDGKTPLHLAIEMKNFVLVEAILRLRNADVDLRVRDYRGNNALHTACLGCCTRILQLLLVHAAANSYYTPRRGVVAPATSRELENGKRAFFLLMNYQNLTARDILQRSAQRNASQSLGRAGGGEEVEAGEGEEEHGKEKDVLVVDVDDDNDTDGQDEEVDGDERPHHYKGEEMGRGRVGLQEAPHFFPTPPSTLSQDLSPEEVCPWLWVRVRVRVRISIRIRIRQSPKGACQAPVFATFPKRGRKRLRGFEKKKKEEEKRSRRGRMRRRSRRIREEVE